MNWIAARRCPARQRLPYGYGLLDYSYSWSNYLNTIDNNGWPWRSTGDSETHRLTGSWVVFRNGDIKTGLTTGITHRISRNYLDDVLLDSSSRRLSSVMLGINHTQKVLGGVATLNPSFTHGVPWLGAEDDHDKYGDVPKAEFRKWSLNGSFQRPVATDLWWLSSIYFQCSPDRLYGSERLTLGGESSVRGFKEQYISGDNGGYWRNDLNYSLFTLPWMGQIGVIASTGPADKNQLDTGTLGFSDIHNEADYKTEHQGAGFSTGGSIGKEFAGNMANTLLAGGGNSGHAEGTTQAAVSDGTIIIRDKDNQKQDVADLSRDTEHANGSISPIFDKEKEQNRLQEIQLIGEIGSQAMDIARTQGEIAKAKAMKDPAALTAAKDKLLEEGNSSPTTQEIADQAGRTAMQDYGTGSDLQRGIQAATAALQGLAGGNIAGALAGVSAPELANLIGHGMGIDNNEAAKAVAHAILGAVTAQLNGGSAVAGAAGAVTGELIAHQLFPNIPKDKLSEEQKQLIVALSTVASGLAGGIAGNSTAGALTGAQAGKNSAENNYLSANQSLAFDKELSACRKTGGDCQSIIDKWKKVSDEQSEQLDETLKDDPASALAWDKELAEGGLDMASRPAWMNNISGAGGMSDEQARAYVQQWNSQDLSKIDASTPGWMQFAAFASDPENQAALGALGLLTKDVTVAAISFMSRNTATATVSATDIGMKWGQGNMKQGMPWEDYVGTTLPSTTDRLPVGFRTFDYYDASSKIAYSVKSLDTQTMSRLSKPNQLYSTVKGNIDRAIGFKDASRSGINLDSSMISSKEIKLAIPSETTPTQWTEINRAIEYGKAQGVKVTVTQVKK